MFTHAKLLPPEEFPKGILAHGWLTDTGGRKLSKKEVSTTGGRFPPLDAALERWGADGLRLYLAQAASVEQDIEWDLDTVDTAANRLADVERMVRQLGQPGSGGAPELERWLESALHDAVVAIRAAFDEWTFRDIAEEVYARIPGIFRRYFHRGGTPGAVTQRLANVWVRLLSPITPHLAEELGEGRFASLVAMQPFPSAEEVGYHAPDVDAESFLQRVEEDLQNVLRPAEARGEHPESLAFFVAAAWKATVEQWIHETSDRGADVPLRTIMERARTHPELAAHLAEIPSYIQRVAPQLRTEPSSAPPTFDEAGVLRSAEAYLARRFRVDNIAVYPESAAAPHDPQRRRERARPGRPAFFAVLRPSPGDARAPPRA
jgi:leucyl-tRNA synthetase